jgi:hypothetical protein
MLFNEKREIDRFFICWCIRCCIAVTSGILLSFLIRFEFFPWMLLYIPGWVYDTLDWIIYGSILGGVIGCIQSKMVLNSWSMVARRMIAMMLAYSVLFLFDRIIFAYIDEFLAAVFGCWLIVPISGLVVGISMDRMVWPIVFVSSFLHGGLAGIIIGCVSKIFRVEKGTGIYARMKHYFWSFSLGCVAGSLFLTVINLGMKHFGFKDQSLYIFGLSSLVYWWFAWCLLVVPNWLQNRKDQLDS